MAGPTVSLCMIVRNESEQLPRCLRSVKPWVDEIIVVDTGSQDNTPEIAASFGARVERFTWTGDFSAARNYSLDFATKEWIFFLDADEELAEGSGPRIREALAKGENDGYLLSILNYLGGRADEDSMIGPAIRIFRNRPQYRFCDALHEQILGNIQKAGGTIGWIDAQINHYGYLREYCLKKNKIQRNLEIVKKQVEEQPENAFVHYNLGVEYVRLGDFPAALRSFQNSFKHLPSLNIPYAHLLIHHIVYCLQKLERYAEAHKIIDDALEAYPDYTDLRYLRGSLFLETYALDEAHAAFLECLEHGDASPLYFRHEGVGSYRAWTSLGYVAELKGRDEEAVTAYVQALKQKNDYLPAVNHLFRLLLGHDEVSASLAFMERIVNTANGDVILHLADLLTESGHFAPAETFLARYWQEEKAPAFFIRLGQLASLQRDYEKALTLFAKVSSTADEYGLCLQGQALNFALCGQEDKFLSTLEELDKVEAYRFFTTALRLTFGGRAHLLQPAGELSVEERQGIQAQMAWLLKQLLIREEGSWFKRGSEALRAYGFLEEEVAALRGRVYLQCGEKDYAAQELLNAVRAGSKEADVYYLLGNICQEKELLDEAEEFYKEAISLNPHRINLYAELSSLFLKRYKYQEALMIIKRGLDIEPKNKLLQAILTRCLRLGKQMQWG